MASKDVKHPCVGCIYFKECGTSGRTQRCEGRVTKSDIDKHRRPKKGIIFR